MSTPIATILIKASSSQDVWHYLLLAAAFLFFADVFVRRVQVSFAWLPPLLGRVRDRVLRREPKAAPVETIERLRSRKAAISQQIEERRAAARFEPTPDAPAPDLETLSPGGTPPTAAPGATGSASAPPKPGAGPSPEPKKEDDDYTSRLLRAKREARKDRKDDGPT